MDTHFFELDARTEAMAEQLARASAATSREFCEKLDVSWIYHDNALEGVVLSYPEIRAAIDSRIISDVTLIPMYEEIQNHKLAIDWVREQASRKRVPITLETLRKLYFLLEPETPPKVCPYRRENPLHRAYFHEITPPEKIAYRMRKLVEWLGSEEAKRIHPVGRASLAHFRLMSIYPWMRHSGRVARLLMNLMLLRDGYLPAIIHGIERQRYYESLRLENAGLTSLVVESIHASMETATRYVACAPAEMLRARAAS